MTTWLPAREPGDALRRLAGTEEEAGTAARWVALVLAAMLAKLTASVDDVVWLFPFLSGKRKLRNTLCYVACMQFVVAVAWGFSVGGASALSAIVPVDSPMALAKILQLISAVLLTLYTFKLLCEWWLEGQEEAKEESVDDSPAEESGTSKLEGGYILEDLDDVPSLPGSPAATILGNAEQSEGMPARSRSLETEDGEARVAVEKEAAVEVEAKPEQYSLRKLVTISMFGSIDDFAVYVSVLLSGMFSPIQLFLGTLLGSIVVVVVVVSAGKCACMTRMIERIPLWVIIGAFAIWTYISTFALS